jgi:hypothetical protein
VTVRPPGERLEPRYAPEEFAFVLGDLIRS